MWTIFGAGNLIWDIIDATGGLAQVEQVVLNQSVEIDLDGLKVVSWEEYLVTASMNMSSKIFGYLNTNKQVFLNKLENWRFSNLIHPAAYISWVDYHKRLWGTGNFFGANSTIASRVNIGNFNFINRNASVGHDTTIGSFSHIGPGAIVCGRCRIGSKSYIGAGSVIRDGVVIGDGVTVGAGAIVVKDLVEPGIYVGNPAKILKSTQ